MSDGELVNSDEGGLSDTEADLRGRLLQKRERKISEHRDDHDDAVAIKPPQAEVHHRSHHRKHRKERRKEKDLRSRSPSSKHSADHKVKKDPRDSPLRATQRKPPEVVHLEKRAEEGWAQWKKSLDGRSGSNAEPRERRRSPVVDERSRNRPRRGHSPIRVPQKVDHRDEHAGTSRRGVVGVEPRSHDRSRSPLQKSGDRTRWLPQVAPQQRSQSKHSSDERHHRRRSKESSHRRDRMSTEIVVVDKLEGGELPVSPPMPFVEGQSAEDPLVATPTQDELGDNPGENVSNDISGDGEIISDVDEESVHSSHHHSSEESSHEEVPEGSASDRSSKSSGASSDRSAGSATNGKKHHKKHIEDKRSNKYSKFETSSEEESENEDQTKSRSHSPDNAEMSPHGKASEGDHTGDEEAPSPLPEVAAEEEEPKEKEDPFALLPVYYPAISGCRSVDEFACLNRIDEGTYGVVYRCRDKRTDEMVALKRLKMEKEKDDFPITSLREIVTLLKAQHPNIITVREIVVGSNMDKIYIVMDFLEHDMKELMERMESMKKSFLIGEVKTLMRQILAGVQHLHDNWILHRDLKTSNLLLSHKGILKIGDFGLAREYGSPLKPYTQVVVTLWYRAPELLLGTKLYSTAIDVWSVGCIFGELLNLKALFPGKSELDELGRIYRDLGTPTDKIWPGYSELPGVKRFNLPQVTHNQLRKRFGPDLSAAGFCLMNRLLTYSPEKRISAQEALKHEWFDETPHPVPPSMFPTWPAKSEMGKPVRTGNKTPPPPPGRRANDKSEADEMVKMGFQLRPGAQKPGDWHLRL